MPVESCSRYGFSRWHPLAYPLSSGPMISRPQFFTGDTATLVVGSTFETLSSVSVDDVPFSSDGQS